MIADKLNPQEIGHYLGVDELVVNKWLAKVPTPQTSGLIRNNAERRTKLINTDKSLLKNFSFNIENSRLLCAILYGCEGAKYPSSNIVSLTNSDPGLISSFVNLMRHSYSLDESKWRVVMQIHSDQDFVLLRKYWGELLKINKKYFYKPTVTVSSGKKHRNGYVGTCSVRYSDYRIQLRLIGIFNEFLRKSVE